MKFNNKIDSISFVLTLQPNPRFVKQINYLSKYFNVQVIYFERSTMTNYSKELTEDIEQIILGKISNQKYLKRILLFIKMSWILRPRLVKFNPNHIIFDKIDAYILYKLSFIFSRYRIRTKSKIIEIPDLKGIHFNKSLKAKIFRKTETFLMKKEINKLLLTSPGFFDNYYSKFFTGKTFILENKPLASNLPGKFAVKKISGKKEDSVLRLGIIGGLNRGKPTKALLELAVQNSWLDILVFGLGPDEKMIKGYSEKCSNVNFFGPFNFFQDIADIYSSIDVAYVVYDTTKQSMNTKWALPNKLYECMYFNIPLIVSPDTLLADRVLEKGIGLTVDFTNKHKLLSTLRTMKDKKNQFLFNMSKLEDEEYLGDTDYEQLVSFIKS